MFCAHFCMMKMMSSFLFKLSFKKFLFSRPYFFLADCFGPLLLEIHREGLDK